MTHSTRTPDQDSSPPRRTIRWRGPLALSLGALIAAGGVGNAMAAATESPTTIQENDRKERRAQDGEQSRDRKRERDGAQDRDRKRERDGAQDRDRKQGARGKNQGEERSRDDASAGNNRIGSMLIKLGNAVESGEISAEDAMRRILGIAERMNLSDRGDTTDDAGKKRRYEAASQDIKEAVREGSITKEQARERLQGLKKKLWGNDDKSRTSDRGDSSRAEQRLREAVRSGKISEDEARRRLDEMRNTNADDARKKEPRDGRDRRRRE
jgi:polyhydroxyalkanoate synthesis regulator phasin